MSPVPLLIQTRCQEGKIQESPSVERKQGSLNVVDEGTGFKLKGLCDRWLLLDFDCRLNGRWLHHHLDGPGLPHGHRYAGYPDGREAHEVRGQFVRAHGKQRRYEPALGRSAIGTLDANTEVREPDRDCAEHRACLIPDNPFDVSSRHLGLRAKRHRKPQNCCDQRPYRPKLTMRSPLLY